MFTLIIVIITLMGVFVMFLQYSHNYINEVFGCVWELNTIVIITLIVCLG